LDNNHTCDIFLSHLMMCMQLWRYYKFMLDDSPPPDESRLCSIQKRQNNIYSIRKQVKKKYNNSQSFPSFAFLSCLMQLCNQIPALMSIVQNVNVHIKCCLQLWYLIFYNEGLHHVMFCNILMLWTFLFLPTEWKKNNALQMLSHFKSETFLKAQKG